MTPLDYKIEQARRLDLEQRQVDRERFEPWSDADIKAELERRGERPADDLEFDLWA